MSKIRRNLREIESSAILNFQSLISNKMIINSPAIRKRIKGNLPYRCYYLLVTRLYSNVELLTNFSCNVGSLYTNNTQSMPRKFNYA